MFDGSGERAWRFARATVIGSSHLRTGTPCQDASACELVSPAGAPVLVAVVSDGAGSAPLSQVGSRLACRVVVDRVTEYFAQGGSLEQLERDFAIDVLRDVRVRLTRAARHLERPLRDLACTLLWAVVGERHAAFAQIGDGAIVTAPSFDAERGHYGWVFWPQQGEYANQTTFATGAHAAEEMCFETRPCRVEELALFSDGLQSLVLDYRRRTAHERFFTPMFTAVRWARPGLSSGLSRSLERMLGSRTVLARTDDDKSLVLASRAQPEPQAPLPAPAPAASPAAIERPVRADGPVTGRLEGQS